jgi:hypothetical protein
LRAQHQTGKTAPNLVMWHRRELDRILRVYGGMVAQGHWRDYAIDGLADCAIFSIYRMASECPLYSVIKSPADARKQGQYRIVGMAGQVLKRGHDLDQVLRVFDKKRLRLVN